MRLDDMYPSRWLKASDLHSKPALHTIDGLGSEEFEDGETKHVLKLKGGKGLILNRTNASLISTFLGEDTDAWVGKQIVLYPAKVEFRGRLVDSIRVREPRMPASAVIAEALSQRPPPAPAAPRTQPPVVAGPDDDVPF